MRHQKTKLGGLFILMAAVAFGFNNCGGVNFNKEVPAVQDLSSEGFLSLSYTAPDLSKPVDVIFVIDNSRSMTLELKNLGARFPQLAAMLDQKDWQACLLTTDWENERGYFRPWKGADFILSPQMANYDAIFQDTLNHITEEDLSSFSYYEHGIYSAYEAFGRAFTPDARGCFRPGAEKAVVIVSDEDELGKGWDLPDGTVTEQPQEGDKPENLVLRAKEIFGTDVSFTAHVVGIAPGDLSCLDQQRKESGSYDESYGYEARKYKELTDMTGGVFVNICQDDYSQSLSEIGQMMSQKVTEVSLPCANGIEEVRADGHDLSIHENSVSLNPALLPGENVVFLYKCFN